jgi:hypothetical protein
VDAGGVAGKHGWSQVVTGSSYVALVVPIMAFTAMAFWLGLVFYADSHPRYGGRQSSKRPSPASPRHAASRPRADDLGELPDAGTSDAIRSAQREQTDDEILAGRAS